LRGKILDGCFVRIYPFIRNNRCKQMTDSLDLLKALSDSVRLRIVRAISQAELSVAELVSVLGLPQSTVSRHLKPLRDCGLLETRRDGTSVFYRRGAALADQVLASFVDQQAEQMAQAAEDRASVRRVLDLRKRASREFFDRIAGSYGSLTEPGGGWPALAAGLAAGFAGRSVADLGAGEGDLSLLLGRYARRVASVDASPQMLQLLRDKAEAAGLADRIQALQGDIEALPLPDGGMDAAFLSQSLHHAAKPADAVGEAARILRPGGLLVVLDLVQHEQEWVREQWADQWLGFAPQEVRQWMEAAGMNLLHEERIDGSTPDLAVLILVGKKKERT
jgi:ArsR family transcriptional regulator